MSDTTDTKIDTFISDAEAVLGDDNSLEPYELKELARRMVRKGWCPAAPRRPAPRREADGNVAV